LTPRFERKMDSRGRLGRAHLADLRRDLANDLLGVPLDDDLGGLRNLELDTVGCVDLDGV
jgi:hypothetical protein